MSEPDMTTNDELKPGTPLPWEADTIQSEGEYGVGPDTVAGFAVSAIYDAQGNVLFDALNSDVIEVHEDYADEDGFCSAWDATSAANAAYIVHACNAYPALTAEVVRLKARLEVVDGWSEDVDGIACRNDTIKLQDGRIEALTAERDRLAGEVERLRALLPYIQADYMECNGGKCRQKTCASCFGDDYASQQSDIATALLIEARAYFGDDA